jgi:hypothetical protein
VRTGTSDPATLARFALPEPKQIDATFVVQVRWELAGVDIDGALPPALHPTSPLLLSLLAYDGGAVVTLSCRHGARARALVIAATEAAQFDGSTLTVPDVAEVALDGPAKHLGGDDVQYVTNLWPVDMEGRGLRLVQQEVEVHTPGEERYRPRLVSWTAALPRPAHPVAATVGYGQLVLPAVRFVARADVPAHLGSEKL